MKEVLILGNGTTRLDLEEEIATYDCPVWVCNHAYREKLRYEHICLVGTVHDFVIERAKDFRKSLGDSTYSIITREKYKHLLEEGDQTFSVEKGWSSGNLLILHALNMDYDKIYLAGFDFGGSDIYQPMSTPGVNFKNQYQEITEKLFPEKKDRIFFLEKGMFFERGVQI